jgi:PPOX class probable F420-dependent enzyme
MKLEQFERQSYMNIETFRKNGAGVKTPVWFVRDGETLFVWTQTGTGKAKRIRNNGTVNIVPSTGSGEPVGEWQPARAQVEESPEAMDRVVSLMKKKYGIIFNLLGFLGKLRKGTKYVVVKVQA